MYRYMDFFYCFTFTMISFESGLIRAVNSSYISDAWIRFLLVDQSSWPAGMRLTLNACELAGICYATIWYIALFRCRVIYIWNKNKQQNIPNCTKAIYWFTTCILGTAVCMCLDLSIFIWFRWLFLLVSHMTQDLAKDQAWKPMVSVILIGHMPTWFVFYILLGGSERMDGDSPCVFTCSCYWFCQELFHHFSQK